LKYLIPILLNKSSVLSEEALLIQIISTGFDVMFSQRDQIQGRILFSSLYAIIAMVAIGSLF
jgi:hypothetical protein